VTVSAARSGGTDPDVEPTRILVTGATGFVGSRLVPALVAEGYDVRAMTRRPAEYDAPGTAVGGDVHDGATLGPALDGVAVVYYLVHSLDADDFEDRDARAARTFGTAAAEAGVRQIVYLGGLGAEDSDLSAHLRSRREVEGLLGGGGVPVTVLRAGIVVGRGGISWELTRQLVKNLPAMVVPKWVSTRTQPIALDDVVDLLAGAVDVEQVPPGHYDVGAPESVTYRQMMLTIAHELGHRRLIVPVPVLTPRLSSFWLRLVTTVDMQTARNLVDSMTNTVVVHEHRLEGLTGVTPRPFEQAAREALAEHDT
jgi:uncharacterized protein YbjT (DUF2867 family)